MERIGGKWLICPGFNAGIVARMTMGYVQNVCSRDENVGNFFRITLNWWRVSGKRRRNRKRESIYGEYMFEFGKQHWLNKWDAQWLVDCEREVVWILQCIHGFHHHRFVAFDRHAMVSLHPLALSLFVVCLVAFWMVRGLMLVCSPKIDDEHIDWAHLSHCTTLCAVCALKMKMMNVASLSSDQVDDWKRLNGTFFFFAFKFKFVRIMQHA